MFLWRVLMAEEIPTGDKAVFAFLEMIALAFAFEGVNAMLNGRPWFIYVGSFFAALVFFLAGIKWPYLKSALARGNLVVFWAISILATWVPAGYAYYQWHQSSPAPPSAVFGAGSLPSWAMNVNDWNAYPLKKIE